MTRCVLLAATGAAQTVVAETVLVLPPDAAEAARP